MWFWGPQFVGGGDTPDFVHAFSSRTHIRACVQFWLSSVQRDRRVADKKEEKKIESVIKYKSANKYVGGPNDTFCL